MATAKSARRERATAVATESASGRRCRPLTSLQRRSASGQLRDTELVAEAQPRRAGVLARGRTAARDVSRHARWRPLAMVVATILGFVAMAASPPSASAATLPPGLVESTIGGLNSPTAMAFAPDGRLFISEQTGALRIVQNGVLLPTPFVTLPVDSAGERGLLGIAFPPDFATSHRVYVYYTQPTPSPHNVVAWFGGANGNTATTGPNVVVTLPNLSSATNHNGGGIHFS